MKVVAIDPISEVSANGWNLTPSFVEMWPPDTLVNFPWLILYCAASDPTVVVSPLDLTHTGCTIARRRLAEGELGSTCRTKGVPEFASSSVHGIGTTVTVDCTIV